MSETKTAFLDTAIRIGHELCRDALWSGGRCNWLGWSMEGHRGQWLPAYRASGAEPYSGTSGIGLFLAQLHRFAGEKIIADTARGAAAHAISVIAEMDEPARIGFYAGQSGAAYYLMEIGELLGEPEFVELGLETLVALRELGVDDKTIDVIGGSAGVIPALLDVAKRHDKPELAELASVHGEHLLETALRTDAGWCWDTMHVPGQKPLLGYSHGAAGIVCALLELHHATGDRRFAEGARGGLAYERGLFSEAHGNWPDLRILDPSQADTEPSYTLAWCHGAPGIGAGRIRTAELLRDDPAVGEEIEAAIRATAPGLRQPVAQGYGNYSQCHGVAGNAELMLLAADRLGREELRGIAETAGQNGIQHTALPDLPWACGLQKAGVTPSLMLGLAGIGYFYLRLYDSRSVPSLLIVIPAE